MAQEGPGKGHVKSSSTSAPNSFLRVSLSLNSQRGASRIHRELEGGSASNELQPAAHGIRVLPQHRACPQGSGSGEASEISPARLRTECEPFHQPTPVPPSL